MLTRTGPGKTGWIGPCLALVSLLASLLVSSAATAEPAPGVPKAASQFRKHGVADAPATQAGLLRLATYNIHELYDDADDPLLSGRVDDLSRTMSASRRAAAGDVLARIAADVLALQEVESLAALEWFRDTHLAGLGYEHAVSVDVGHAIGLEQAVLSRVPIIDSRVWADRHIGVHPPTYRGRPNKYAGEPLLFRRSPLMVELDVSGWEGAGEAAGGDQEHGKETGGVPVPPRRKEETTGGVPTPRVGADGKTWSEADRLTLLVIHMKTGSGSDEWRQAEAAALLGIAEELRADRPGRRIVMLGDFVGEPGKAQHVDMLLGGRFTDIFAGLASGGQTPRDEIATDIGGRRECLILAGEGALPMFAGHARFVVGTAAPPGKVPRDVAFGMPGFASDHYPVVADLDPRVVVEAGASEPD